MKIPNLKDPESFVGFLREFAYAELDVNKKIKLEEDKDNDYRWLEYYWIANYLCNDNIQDKAAKKLACKSQSACLQMILETGAPESFIDKFKEFRKQENDKHQVDEGRRRNLGGFSFGSIDRNLPCYYLSDEELGKVAMKPEIILDDRKIKQLNQLGYNVTLGLNLSEYSIPVEFDGDKNLKVRTDLGGRDGWKRFSNY